MEPQNQTLFQDFILIGFSQDLKTNILLFLIFLVMYMLTILGNTFLILTVIVSPKLHTPMYYFLCNLSFIDLCFSSSTVPSFLIDIFTRTRRISLIGCLIQVIFGTFLGVAECVLLAVMAYDRYIAICLPLYYTTIMSWRVCRYITFISSTGSLVVTAFPSVAKPLEFCKENTLNHFSCDILHLVEVACENVSFYQIFIYFFAICVVLLSPAFIVVSYISIIISLLKVHSTDSRFKAFSTCASHLTVVVMFFGTLMAMYIGGQAGSLSHMKYYAIIYNVITPVINPLVYSLRNNEVKQAFGKLLAPVSRL